MNVRPAYAKMYDAIKKEIIDGEYAVGELLPAEPELEKQFNVSRTTVRRAIELLSREGLVHKKQGRGTEVLDYKTSQNLNVVTSISETLRQKGYEVSSKSMHIDTTKANSRLAKQLEVNVKDELIRIQRIQLADGRPVAIMKNYIIPEKVPGIVNYVNKFSSLYEFLEERYNINIDSARDSISAKCADFNDATMLDVPIGSPILYMRRVAFEGGKPVCADRISIVGDKYEVDINMIGRHKSDFHKK
jgi:DNA-binding GntR family transcriptional regulator